MSDFESIPQPEESLEDTLKRLGATIDRLSKGVAENGKAIDDLLTAIRTRQLAQ